MVSRAEEFVARRRKAVAAPARRGTADVAQVAPIVRGACSEKDKTIEGAWRRLMLEFRATDAVLNFVNAKDLARVSQAGVVTPDHTIRTKNWPLVLPPPDPGKTCRLRPRRARHGGPIRRALSPLFRAAQCPRRPYQT